MSYQQAQGNVKLIDWNRTKEYAEKLSIEGLRYAIKDCLDCVKGGVDEGFYSDQASVYQKELNERLNLRKKLNSYIGNINGIGR